ncbi:hypothetical protein ACJMK2_010783 [Sinanodonta woodiana]|uniref:Transporter n=1 Tax=Sinanodonta woodiana TaxID=1069815 RepID=A0ABD3VJG7_SINWO
MGKKRTMDETPAELMQPLSVGEDTEGIGTNSVKRQGFDSKLQYIFMVISYAVGFGNVWRFPYLVQQHGGGAFLIPYTIMLVLEGMPLLFLELSIGQHMQKGTVILWNQINPLLGGIGIASAVTSFNVALYYNGLVMWCFFYLFHSFQSPLPWAYCPTEFQEALNKTVVVEECEKGGSTSYFWYRQALDVSSGLEESDGIKWKMLLCLIFSWLVVYACIWKGIKSSGKVVYITATFPYVVLIIFFGRGITLKGAADGLVHLFYPKIERLLDPLVWLDAASQIFFSFGLAFGGLINFSSFNKKNNNCKKDAIIISLVNYFTAIFAAIVIFSILGFKANLQHDHCIQHNIEVLENAYPNYTNDGQITVHQYTTDFMNNASLVNLTEIRSCDLQKELETAAQGAGLAFIVFTQAIVEFGPSAPFWSIIFFLMLLSLGLGSEFGTIEGVTASIYDLEPFPWIRKKWLVSGVLCTICCLVGMIFVLGSGTYWVSLFDSFAGSFPLISIALAECIVIGWVYGVDKFGHDIELMVGSTTGRYWKIVWKFIAPVLVLVILLATLISKIINPITYQAYDKEQAKMVDKGYPWYGGMVAFILIFSAVLCIPAVAILRKLGISKWNSAKYHQAETGGYTESTAKFIRSVSSIGSDEDLADDVNSKSPTRNTSCDKPESVRFSLQSFKI